MEIEEINGLLRKEVDGYIEVTNEDLERYFDGPAPSGDTTTLEDVLGNQWLLIHEMVEVSELKKMGLEVDASVLDRYPLEVDKAHLVALEQEMRFASEGGDVEWVQRRLRGLRFWLDEDPPEAIRSGCLKLLAKYSE